MRLKRIARSLAILCFGIAVPVTLLWQANIALSTLGAKVDGALSTQTPGEAIEASKAVLRDGNDYALYSQLSSERVNEAVVVNKQVMKIVVMQIGFSVISIGIMFVILGINDGGGEGGLGLADLKLDFKTGSTGALVFTIGAAMAAAGGIMKNDYATVPIPNFAQGSDPVTNRYRQSIEAYKQCQRLGVQRADECFSRIFAQVNAEAIG